MISQIVGIMYSSWFIEFLRSFILSYQWPDMHTWGVILVLRLTPTRGPLFVTMQQWHNFWSIHLVIIQIFLRPSLNSLCSTLHKIQRNKLRSTLRSPRAYLIRLNPCWASWQRSKVTRTTCLIWCVNLRIEEAESKYHQNNSQLTELFLLMFSMCRNRYWKTMTAMSLKWIFHWHLIQWLNLWLTCYL